MRSSAQHAELALLLEVSGSPKPGNVDRFRDLEGLTYEHFLAGAVGARAGLELAGEGGSIGDAFERAVDGMAAQGGGNTQFGALLLLVPLVSASRGTLTPDRVSAVVEATTVADAAAFYRAFDHVDVFVPEPTDSLADLDVRLGSEAIPELERRDLSLFELMELSSPTDDVAREWVEGFGRTFAAADSLANRSSPLERRTAAVFLELLADRPDTLVANQHGPTVATEVCDRATTLCERNALEVDPDAVESFADELVDRGVNPGTTADLTAGGLYVALERGSILV